MKAARSELIRQVGERVLVIEDDLAVCSSIQMLLASSGYTVTQTHTAQDGVRRAISGTFDLIIVDLRLPDATGLKVIGAIKKARETAPIILMTGYSSVENAVQALREGAVDYIIKPFNNEEFVYSAKRALAERYMRRENAILKRNLQKVCSGNEIIGESAGIKRVLDLVRRVASSDATVYIRGESGTGKELVAQAIHHASPRAEKPFVPVNCGAIPVDLMESELFGHTKGAFTGAIGSTDGLIMEAHGGTLLLDEIGELPMHLQVKLLRVIEEKSVRPVGGKELYRVDVRFIAASNKDLKQAVAQGQFREDLFYRLNVINIHVPPLREREGDVELLTRYFINYYSKKIGKRIRQLDSGFKAFMNSYHWPGNVRELRNLIERAAILTDSDVLTYEDMSDTPLLVAKPASVTEIGKQPMPVEEYIQHVVKAYQSTHSEIEIARMLGIGRKALWVRRRRWGLARMPSA